MNKSVIKLLNKKIHYFSNNLIYIYYWMHNGCYMVLSVKHR